MIKNFAETILFVADAGIEPDVSLTQLWVMSPASLTSTLIRDLVRRKGFSPLFTHKSGCLKIRRPPYKNSSYPLSHKEE